MNVFDFDNTIYNGESSLDFFLYCLKRKKSLGKYIPLILLKAIKYKLSLASSEDLYYLANNMGEIFIENTEDLDKIILDFWQENNHKLNKKIMSLIKEKDIIISASPRFLLEGANLYLPKCNYLCTEFDTTTGKLEYACFKENKIKAYKENYKNEKIDKFYTDSIKDDKSLIDYATESYIVNNCKEIKKYVKKKF